MSSVRAMREGASSVAAGTPKKGTKAASFTPKSMVGHVEEGGRPSDRARMRRIGVPRAVGLGACPKRSRPALSTRSK
jgi:hypothetical protein